MAADVRPMIFRRDDRSVPADEELVQRPADRPHAFVEDVLKLQRTAGNAAVSRALLLRSKSTGQAQAELVRGLGGTEEHEDSDSDSETEEHEDSDGGTEEDSEGEVTVEGLLNDASEEVAAIVQAIPIAQRWIEQGDTDELRVFIDALTGLDEGEFGVRWLYAGKEARAVIASRLAELVPVLLRHVDAAEFDADNDVLLVHGSYLFGPGGTDPGDIDVIDTSKTLTGTTPLSKEDELSRWPTSGDLTVGSKGGPIDLIGGIVVLGSMSLGAYAPAELWAEIRAPVRELANGPKKQKKADKQNEAKALRWLINAGLALYHVHQLVVGSGKPSAAELRKQSTAFVSLFEKVLANADSALSGGSLKTNVADLLAAVTQQWDITNTFFGKHGDEYQEEDEDEEDEEGSE
jgi:hypothetical protein